MKEMDKGIAAIFDNELTSTPLVSIVIITYNSAKYIVETLESAKNQSYKNIELIVSDDYSVDGTVELCNKWLSENKCRFVSTKLIKTPKNTGIPGNCNRGVNSSTGQWIKIIAGDDILLPNCILENIEFIKKNNEASIVISNLVVFLDETDPKQILDIQKPTKPNLWSSLSTSKEQYEALLMDFFGSAPSYFTSKEVFLKISFDERFPFIEDYPFALNATKNGFKIIYHDKDTVMYRRRNDSVFYGSNETLFGDFYEKRLKFDEIYRYPFLSPKRKKYEVFNYKRQVLLNKLKLNRSTLICRIINKISSHMNPYR